MTVTHGVRVHRYPTHPLLGRHQRLDGRSLAYTHRSNPARTLRPTHFEPAVPVLDQSNLWEQGIDVSKIVPGAAPFRALGSCTGNSALEAVSRLLTVGQAKAVDLDMSDPKGCEAWAIDQYARSTIVDDCPGGMPEEDTGSSGLANAQVLKSRGLVVEYTHALDADSFAAMLQTDGVMLGVPWFEAWFEPDRLGFIDYNPRWLESGLAVEHEIYATGLETVVQDHAGRVVLDKTVVTFRNHWGKWGDQGSGRVRLSTLYGFVLRQQVDAIQIHA